MLALEPSQPNKKAASPSRTNFGLRFLSILSIKRGNWFYWADRAETAERAEIKESVLLICICIYLAA
jgi:hypothetical protein